MPRTTARKGIYLFEIGAESVNRKLTGALWRAVDPSKSCEHEEPTGATRHRDVHARGGGWWPGRERGSHDRNR